jgi:hypothetical protein
MSLVFHKRYVMWKICMLLVTYDSQLFFIHVTQHFVAIKLRYSFVLAKIGTTEHRCSLCCSKIISTKYLMQMNPLLDDWLH